MSICPPTAWTISLPLSICRHAAWSISCLPLYIWGHAARSFSCPASLHLPACWMIHLLLAFPVHLPACCMINLLPCLFCPSGGLMHAKSPALPLLFVCWPAAWSVSYSASSTYLSAWCMLHLQPFLSIWQHAAWSISCPVFTVRLLACCMINLLLCHFYLSVSLLPDLSPALPLLSICRPAAWPSLALPLLSVFRPAAWSTSCPAQMWYDTNGRFQMQGGKNWNFPKEINANRFFWDSHLLEIWSNHFFLFMGPYGRSVAMDSVSKRMHKCSDIEA